MYYSEFTLQLIDEVKKREILYNTKYDKRPKTEKENAWKEIGGILSATPEKCKKHWKNVRDRFVKVKNLRDKHFSAGGSELDAPIYMYFNQLNFMSEYSIKKESFVSQLTVDATVSQNISPEGLILEEEDSSGSTSYFDYTEQFLEHVAKFPVLYDEKAELRKYRSKEAWKSVAEFLGSKFTVGKLRLYWTTLMRKYKLYLENSCAPIENEEIFERLSFTNIGVQVKSLNSPTHYVFQIEDDADSLHEEEHLICEEVEGDDELLHEEEKFEENQPPSKKCKIEIENETSKESEMPKTVNTQQQQMTSDALQDEYDFFGKKVALQLRNLAKKNRNVARKGEIKVLQLLMELEERLDDE